MSTSALIEALFNKDEQETIQVPESSTGPSYLTNLVQEFLLNTKVDTVILENTCIKFGSHVAFEYEAGGEYWLGVSRAKVKIPKYPRNNRFDATELTHHFNGCLDNWYLTEYQLSEDTIEFDLKFHDMDLYYSLNEIIQSEVLDLSRGLDAYLTLMGAKDYELEITIDEI
ncbi:hypothetical protein [Sporosarcina sp. FSL K6-5500]|uniref:hypothetical protein n=1 Tax=Sporosarcina sp. FSL K6-5500 TaxID=2921558 RepID=UPI0030FB884D